MICFLAYVLITASAAPPPASAANCKVSASTPTNGATGKGEVTYVGTDPDYKNKYDDILRGWGFDPKYYEIEGTVRASSWEGQLKGGRTTTFFAFKGVVKRKNPALDQYFDKLVKEYSRKPKLKDTNFGGDTAFIWTMADWQLGKADYGVENTLKRYEEALIRE